VSAGQPVSLSWTLVDGADWYGMMVYNWYDSAGFTYARSWYASTDQASITFPPDGQPANSRYDVRIIAVTGPVPGQGSDNLSGPDLEGTIYCATRDTKISVRVGQGVSSGVERLCNPDETEPSIIQGLCAPSSSLEMTISYRWQKGDLL